MDYYQVISDEKELKWFFDHCVIKPALNESYSAVFVCRHKKLTDDEKNNLGMSKRDSEFISTQVFKNKPTPTSMTEEELQNLDWDFNRFLKTLKRFNVDKSAYMTDLGCYLPEKALAIIFYINPCDDMKVADKVCEKINEAKTTIASGLLGGKSLGELVFAYSAFTKLDSNIKHYKANCKGSRYWLDFDIDTPKWFKDSKTMTSYHNYYNLLKEKLTKTFGKGNYVIVDTSGGYHVLVKTFVIKSNPHLFCKEVEEIYKLGVADGNPEYVDEKGNCKFEAIVNDCQIPGIPLPGTYQYGREVRVLNKEDFDS